MRKRRKHTLKALQLFEHGRRCIVFGFAFALFAIPLFYRQPPTAQLSFEVASIKRNGSADSRRFITTIPGRFVATGMSAKSLVAYAYRLRDFRIFGGPAWINTDRWDIDAKIEEGGVPPRTLISNVPGPVAMMVQTLLEDRFKLRTHHEKREFPVYELVVAKSGARIRLTEDQTPVGYAEGQSRSGSMTSSGPLARGAMRISKGSFEARAVPLAYFINSITQSVDRTVLDKTNLDGLYDIKLHWTPDFLHDPGSFDGVPPQASERPSFFAWPSLLTAIKEQLGLQLAPSKAPLEVIVIDAIQKPTPN